MSILDDPDAYAALCALRHLAGPNLDPSRVSDELARRIRRRVATGTVRMAPPPGDLDLSGLSPDQATALGEAWREGVQDFLSPGRGRGLRLQIERGRIVLDASILHRLRSASGADALSIVDRSVRGPSRWSWPLKVLALGTDAEGGLGDYYHSALLQRVEDEWQGADLLVADHPSLVESFPIEIGVGLILTFVDSDAEMEAARSVELDLRIPYRALAVVRRPDSPRDFLHSFLDELSHDLPPDVALAHSLPSVDEYVVCGDAGFLDGARVSLATADLESSLEQSFGRGRLDRADFEEAMDAMGQVPPPHPGLWTHEGGAARHSVEVTRSAREALERAEPTPGALDRTFGAPTVRRGGSRGGGPRGAGEGSPPTRGGPPTGARGGDAGSGGERGGPPEEEAGSEETPSETSRYLQAQVYARMNDRWTQRMHAFAPDSPHRLDVRIGYADLDWVQHSTSFPDRDLPKDEARLTVVLVAPGLALSSASEEIFLRPKGSSSVARFEFGVPAGSESVDATLIVYHKGKHLQTAQLRGRVAFEDDGEPRIEFERGAPARTDLGHQHEFDLVVWKDGSELVFTVFDADAPPDAPSHTRLEPDLAGIDAVLRGVRDELFQTASKLDQLDGDLATDGIETLRNLAEQGEYLRRTLFTPEVAQRVRRVQVSSPYSSDSFPVEFLYDYPLPDVDAKLCPSFRTTGDALGCSACSAYGGTSAYVCPSGFWGLNRIIERQVRPKDVQCAQSESSDMQPGPLRMESVIFAAADEVNEGDPQRVAKAVQELGLIAPVHVAGDWEAWADLVESHYPALLIALPHNVETAPFQRLRIAADRDLAYNRIASRYFTPEASAIGSPVLLFACNSANATVAYQDFVTKLRCSGAPLVVGAITYVLGPQAASVAEEFTRQLWAQRGSATAGEVIQRVRDTMLKRDNLMALALVAYGDADWLI